MRRLGLTCLLFSSVILYGASGVHHPLTVTSSPIPPCGSGVDPTDVVRVPLNAPLDPAAANGSVVKYEPIANNANDEDDDAEYAKSTPNAISNDNSLFDVGLKSMGASSSNWVKIKIILKDNRYSFYSDSTFNGVGIGDTGNHSNLCYKGDGVIKSKPNANGHTVAVFFAQVQSATTQAGAYNVGLQVVGQSTAIFIDPKLMNNG